MAFTLAALKTELTTDPSQLGYAASVATRDDSITAELINRVRVAIAIKRADIAPSDVVIAIDVTDYTALPGTPTAAQLSSERRFLSWMEAAISVPSLRLVNEDGTDTMVTKNFKAMFPAGSGTLTRLTALGLRAGSRAEQLFGAGTIITAGDVAAAVTS